MSFTMTITRTNFFRVTDKASFYKLMEKVHVTDDGELCIWELEKDPSKVAFGCYGEIVGFMKAYPDIELPGMDKPVTIYDVYDDGYDDFLKELQELLPEQEACLITDISHTKLQSVHAHIATVTKHSISYEGIWDTAVQKVRDQFDICNWDTQVEN